jgi:Fe-S cluster assembly scaffold protein SufB
MSEGIQNSSVSLLEESIILSDKVKIKNLPLLDIRSKNIMASHGAKIYRLD